MKYAIVIPDGAADEPQDALGGKTPLEAAHTPAMDAIAAKGVVGLASHVPADLPAGSAVATLSLLGYDPAVHFTGRAPLEAAAQGVELAAEDWAVRCNLVTVEHQVMVDFTAGHVSSEEAVELLETAQRHCHNPRLEFLPGVSYRNLLIYRGEGAPAAFTSDTRTLPPHDLIGRSVLDDYPRGPGSKLLNDLMAASVGYFADHPVNTARRAAGQRPVTNIWLWGQGQTPQLVPFARRYGCRGAMITAVDLLRGLASLIGWSRIDVPGATGYTDTDYAAKGQAAIAALSAPETDLVCVHVEAPDEASHEGDCAAKVRALEAIDQHIVGPLAEWIEETADSRILVSPDHPTPLRTRTHSHGAVPLAMAGHGVSADGQQAYHERAAAASGLVFDAGWHVMEFFLGRGGDS